MGFFGFLFWMIVFWFVYRAWRERECRRRDYERISRHPAGEQQQAYIEALESRISDLEERLDFTERLLAQRQQLSA